MAILKNTSISGNTSIIPVGTTQQRPSSTTGMIRYNTDIKHIEIYDGSNWKIATFGDEHIAGRTFTAQTLLTNQSNINTNTGELSCFDTDYILNDAGFFQVNSNGFVVQQTGYYEMQVQASTRNTNSTRTNPGLRFFVNGSEISNPRVRSLSSYSRDTSDDESGTYMSMLLNLSAGDRVGIGFLQYGNGGTVELEGNESVASIYYIPNFHGVSCSIANNGNINPGSITQYNIINGAFFNEGNYSISSSGVTVPDSGVYQMMFQYYTDTGSARDCPGMRFLINGSPVGPASAMTYIRARSGHNESSGHNEYIQRLSKGDEINIGFIRFGYSGGTDLIGSLSNLYVRKIE